MFISLILLVDAKLLFNTCELSTSAIWDSAISMHLLPTNTEITHDSYIKFIRNIYEIFIFINIFHFDCHFD